jgi:hypothetical protein
MSKAQRKRKWRERQDTGLEGETAFEALARRLYQRLGIPERVFRGSQNSTYSHFLYEQIRRQEEQQREYWRSAWGESQAELMGYLVEEVTLKETTLLKHVPEVCPVCSTPFSAVYRSKNTAFGGAPPRLLIARRDCSTCRLYRLEYLDALWTEYAGFTVCMEQFIGDGPPANYLWNETLAWRETVFDETKAMYAHPGCRPFLDAYKEKPEDQARFLAFGDYLDENNLFPRNLAGIRAIQAGRQPPPYLTEGGQRE